MKIACIDKNASDKLRLRAMLIEALEFCRDVVGHINVNDIYVSSKDDIIHGIRPNAVVIGHSMDLEDALNATREIRDTYSKISIIVFISKDAYTLRNLRRFQSYTHNIFTSEDPPVRIIHSLNCALDLKRDSNNGKLIVINGVKGGVGATSTAVALAHCAMKFAKSSCVVDLSTYSCVARFLASEKLFSSDYTGAIVNCIDGCFTKLAVDQCLHESHCGIFVMLPPLGGHDIRELWLRNDSSLDLSMSFIEQLQERFDFVFVDCANSEGIFPFALIARSDLRILISTNEPSSVHLLSESFSQTINIPGHKNILVIFNMMDQNSLTYEDVLDHLYTCEEFDRKKMQIFYMPFDKSGKEWIGSGNSFYTESGSHTQALIDKILNIAICKEQIRQHMEETLISNSDFSIANCFSKFKFGKSLFDKKPTLNKLIPQKPARIAHAPLKPTFTYQETVDIVQNE